MASGCLEMIIGPMFSGKTDELMQRLESAKRAGASVIAFKPATDTRTGDFLRTRRFEGKQFDAHTVDSAAALLATVKEEHEVVGIEEVQFFDVDIVKAVQELLKRGKRVIAAGLNTDSFFNPFKPEVVGALVLLAEGGITQREAVCVHCHEPATRTHRLVSGSEQVQVGDSEYEAVCRDCFPK